MAELQVGRDMDVAVARAIGLVPCQAAFHIPGHPHYSSEPCYAKPDNPGQGREVLYYSTSDADALAAVDMMRAKYPAWAFELSNMSQGDNWFAKFREWINGRAGRLIMEPGKSRAEAICRALITLSEQGLG